MSLWRPASLYVDDHNRKDTTMPATHEDAIVLMQLMNWGTSMGIDDSLATLYSPAFNPDDASMENLDVRKVLLFGETAGALVKHGVLDVGLLTDVYWFEGMWGKVRAHALAARAHEQVDALYEHFEALATSPR